MCLRAAEEYLELPEPKLQAQQLEKAAVRLVFRAAWRSLFSPFLPPTPILSFSLFPCSEENARKQELSLPSPHCLGCLFPLEVCPRIFPERPWHREKNTLLEAKPFRLGDRGPQFLMRLCRVWYSHPGIPPVAVGCT